MQTITDEYEVTLLSGDWPPIVITVDARTRARAATVAKREAEKLHPDRSFVVVGISKVS